MINFELKYKSALGTATTMYACAKEKNNKEVVQSLELIFPELKESEDERIRKEILNVFKQLDEGTTILGKKYDYNKWIAWLEKQREQKQHLELKAGHWYFCHQAYCERADILTVKEGEVFKCEKDGIVKGLIIKEPEKYFREITEPTEEVEPKFKVGDWVVQENIGVYKIIEICESWYEVIDFEDNQYSISFDKEHMCYPWTIKDAKDGDVLKEESCIFIIERMKPNGMAKIHCCLFDDGDFSSGSTLSFNIDSTYPATKEQRDLFFEKMKEAGYEWDAEKKELNQCN